MDGYSAPGSGQPVRGMARAVGQAQTFEFKPGASYWTDKVTERLEKIQAPPAVQKARIAHHAEMQVIAWMIESGYKEAELCINRTPCGYRLDLEEWRSIGCHQIMQGFMPRGYRLHVYGTDENGQKAFIASYEGKNPQ